MNFSLSTLMPQTRFSGTGENGKPRVLIAKAGYTHHQFNSFKKRTDVEIVGMAANGAEFIRLLSA